MQNTNLYLNINNNQNTKIRLIKVSSKGTNIPKADIFSWVLILNSVSS